MRVQPSIASKTSPADPLPFPAQHKSLSYMHEQDLIKRWLRPEVLETEAYHTPRADGFVKLDAMENPYGWPSDVVRAWLEHLRTVALNRYPDADAGRLKSCLRRVMEIPEEQQILLGNGSDEIIQIILLSLAKPGSCVLAPEPSFVMYQMISRITGMNFVPVPLHERDFSLDIQAMRKAVERYQPAAVFLAYPNNPTGNLWPRDQVEEIIRCAPGIVVVDEAYTPFTNDNFMQDLNHYQNLLVMRTMSKLGLAGLRLGLLCGPKRWLQEFNKLRLPYNINVLTQASATFVLDHAEMFEQQAMQICEQRTKLYAHLHKTDGIQPYPSEANFILFRTRPGCGEQVFEHIRDQGVLIKNLSAQPLLADCLRVTIGLEEENKRFVEALTQAL